MENTPEDTEEEVAHYIINVETYTEATATQRRNDEKFTLMENCMNNFILEGLIGNERESEAKAPMYKEDSQRISISTQDKCDRCDYIARNGSWLETHRRTMHGD